VAGGPAHTLAALFLEDANLGAARLAFDGRHDARVGDEGRAGEDFAAVFFDEEHLFERELGARLACGAVDGGEAAGRDADLPAAGLNDGVHDAHLCKGESVQLKWLSCKGLARASSGLVWNRSFYFRLPTVRYSVHACPST
jgi:hypothetical protein